MAVAATTLTSGSDATGVTSKSTASVTLTTNRFYLLTVTTRTDANDPNHATATSTGAIWVEVNSNNYDNTGSQKRTTVLRTMVSSNQTGAITIDFAGQTQSDVVWTLDEFTGMDTTGSNGSGAVVQSAVNQDTSGTGTTLTTTLASFSSTNNATWCACSIGNGTGTSTAGTGFSKVSENNTASNLRLMTEFKNTNDTTADYTSSASCELGGIAIEIKSAPIAFDAGNNSGVKASVSSYTFTHTTGASLSNSLLVILVSSRGGAASNADLAITGITYNSVALTKAIARNSADAPSSNTLSTEIWFLKNPSAGANTVSITFSGTVNNSVAYSLTLSGVDQTSPLDATNGSNQNASASPNTTSVTTIADNAWVTDVVYNKIGTSLTKGTNQNLVSTETFPAGGGDTADASYKGPVTPAGSTSMSWTFTGSDDYCQVVASWKPAGTAVTIKAFTLLGVG